MAIMRFGGASAESARLLGNPRGLTLLALQGWGGEIAAAKILLQPSIEGAGECRGLPVHVDYRRLSRAYLPMQKRENTRSSTASVSSSPVISPRARIASRRSMVQKSQGSCCAATSWLRARASAARAARSR